MSAAVPDILARLRRAVLLRRAPSWLAAAAPWLALRMYVATLIVLTLGALDWWLLERRMARCWSTWLDESLPDMEDSSAMLRKADTPVARLQQARLAQRIGPMLGGSAPSRIAARYNGRGLPVAALSLVLAAGWWFVQHAPSLAAAARAEGATPAAHAPAAANALRVHVQAPSYTGLAAIDTEPRDLQIPAGSRVEWCGPGAAIELSNGDTLHAVPCAQWTASESLFWRWQGRRYNIRVVPDEPPHVTITAPKELLTTLAAGTTSVSIAAVMEDDYLVAKATLHLTLARGSGENVRFSDREVPIMASTDAKVRRFDRRWTLAELGMEPGDELYFFIRASDNAEPAHMTQSPTYTLRLPGVVAEGDETSAIPMLVKPESLRSQRQVIIDTEQLIADVKQNPRMAADTVRARSEGIATDQAMLRRRYGQFLGEESTLFGQDEHDDGHKGKLDVLAEYGHAHDQTENATLFDDATKKVLRRALAAMWDAEKALRAVAPKTALAPEYKALEAIKELQQADRIYLHKTAYAPPPIKEEIRLTGDVVGAKPYQREQAAEPEQGGAPVRALLVALGGDAPLPALWTRDALDFIRERIRNDDDRLAAQRAVQDVADGCAACRPALRAWLRGALGEGQPLLQAPVQRDGSFARRLRGEGR